jgi:hypothetical protein
LLAHHVDQLGKDKASMRPLRPSTELVGPWRSSSGRKQALNLDKALNRKNGDHHMQALVLAAVIAHQLGMKIAQRIGGVVGRARLS